ncbi:10503_t:CDS:1, partial [Rhizophagus irregularis]
SDMFINEIENDNDPFENLVSEDEEGNNDQLTEDDSDLIVGNLIKLNHTVEEMEPEKIDHGEMEFNVDDILAKVNSIKENETQ